MKHTNVFRVRSRQNTESHVKRNVFTLASAGHNGIESIDKFIGKDYSRVRVGIGHPKQKKKVNKLTKKK